jgi:hypothetical protein
MAKANGGDYSNPWGNQNEEENRWGADPWQDTEQVNAPPDQAPPDSERRYDTKPSGNDAPAPDTSNWDTNGYAKPGYTAGSYGNVLAGWDNAKWNDQNHQSPKYVVGRILGSVGNLQDPNNRAKAIQQIQQAYPGAQFDGHDTVTIPGIGPVDIFGGASSGEYRPQWLDLTAEAQNAKPVAPDVGGSVISNIVSGGGAGGTSTYKPPTPAATVSAATPPPGSVDPFAAMGGGVYLSNGSWVPKDHPLAISAAQAQNPVTQPGSGGGGGNLDGDNVATEVPAGSSMKDQLMQQLLARSQQGLNIDPNDPVIKQQTDAYSAQAQRARRDYLADTAEGSSPYATGAQRGEERMTAEKLGQDVGGFEAQLVGRELTARRDEVQHALDSMGSLLTEQDRQALQRELAKLDDATRRYGIDTQNAQYYAGLGSADKHFYDQLAQNDRFQGSDDAFRKAQMSQNQSQFLDELGFKTSDRQAWWDAVRSGLISG